MRNLTALALLCWLLGSFPVVEAKVPQKVSIMLSYPSIISQLGALEAAAKSGWWYDKMGEWAPMPQEVGPWPNGEYVNDYELCAFDAKAKDQARGKVLHRLNDKIKKPVQLVEILLKGTTSTKALQETLGQIKDAVAEISRACEADKFTDKTLAAVKELEKLAGMARTTAEAILVAGKAGVPYDAGAGNDGGTLPSEYSH